MAFDGVLAHEQSGSDLSVAEALRHQLKDLHFALREAMNGGGVGHRFKIRARPGSQRPNPRKGFGVQGVPRRRAWLTIASLHLKSYRDDGIIA